MPGLVLLVAALYLALCLYRPMKPFQSRQEVIRYGIPALVIAGVLLAVLSPPPEEDEDQEDQVQATLEQNFPQLTPEDLSRQQQDDLAQRRINKIRAAEDERMDAQLREAARLQAPQPLPPPTR